jgi:hypothetical protein
LLDWDVVSKVKLGFVVVVTLLSVDGFVTVLVEVIADGVVSE